MMCVADLGCWVGSTSVLTEQFLKTQNPQIGALLSKEALVFSGLRHKYDDPQPLSPLTHFIGSLWAKLAINDPTLTPLADGFRITTTYPGSGSLAFKSYKLADVTTRRSSKTSDESSQLVPTGITCTSLANLGEWVRVPRHDSNVRPRDYQTA